MAVPAEWFTVGDHRELCDALKTMRAEGVGADPVSVAERMKRDNKEGFEFERLAKMVEESLSFNLEADLEELRGRWLKRRVLWVANLIYRDIGEGVPAGEAAEKAVARLSDTLEPEDDTIYPLWSVLQKVFYEARSGEAPEVLPTGLGDLDAALAGGLQLGTLVVLGGRTSQGKSALALQVALHVATQGKKVLFCTLEMQKESLAYRILGYETGKEPALLRKVGMAPEAWDRAHVDLERRHANTPLLICEDSGLTSQAVVGLARRVARSEGLDVLVVDYLNILNDTTVPGESRNQVLGRACRALAALAKQLNACVIVLAQLNRLPESTADRIPRIWHLRDSGEVEQIADVVLLIHRETKEDSGSDASAPQKAEIIIGKARNGRTGPVRVLWEPLKVRFTGIDRRH